MRYIIIINNDTYVSSVNLSDKTFTTSSLLSNALVIGKDLKVKCKKIIRSKYTFEDIKMVELSKISHTKLVIEVERSINDQFFDYQPKWTMADWKNGTEEPALEAIEFAKSSQIDGIYKFGDFSKMVAKIVGEKYGLKKKES